MPEHPSLLEARVVELWQTCGACPSQWEGRLEDGRWIYVRYRWGTLEIGVGPTKDAAVDATFRGDGDGWVLVAKERIGGEYDGVLGFRGLVAHAGDLAPGLDLSVVSACNEPPDFEVPGDDLGY